MFLNIFFIIEIYPFKLYSFQWLILINSLFIFNKKYLNIRLILFFTLNLLFRFERVRLVLTPKRRKKPISMREFPHRHGAHWTEFKKVFPCRPISDYITTRQSLPVADEKIKPPSLCPSPASLILIILT